MLDHGRILGRNRSQSRKRIFRHISCTKKRLCQKNLAMASSVGLLTAPRFQLVPHRLFLGGWNRRSKHSILRFSASQPIFFPYRQFQQSRDLCLVVFLQDNTPLSRLLSRLKAMVMLASQQVNFHYMIKVCLISSGTKSSIAFIAATAHPVPRYWRWDLYAKAQTRCGYLGTMCPVGFRGCSCQRNMILGEVKANSSIRRAVSDGKESTRWTYYIARHFTS